MYATASLWKTVLVSQKLDVTDYFYATEEGWLTCWESILLPEVKDEQLLVCILVDPIWNTIPPPFWLLNPHWSLMFQFVLCLPRVRSQKWSTITKQVMVTSICYIY